MGHCVQNIPCQSLAKQIGCTMLIFRCVHSYFPRMVLSFSHFALFVMILPLKALQIIFASVLCESHSIVYTCIEQTPGITSYLGHMQVAGNVQYVHQHLLANVPGI